MPEILNLIAVIPGVVGLWSYNQSLYTTRPQTEGWAYLFAVVIFASPSYYIFEISPISSSFKCLAGSCSFEKFFLEIFLSILIAFLLGSVAARISNKFSKASSDPFHKCCYLWKGSLVFITLKNNKVYLAALLDYTKDLRFESTIRIMPFGSGYRDSRGEVVWTFNYPTEFTAKKKLEIGTVISQREITTFALWDDSITDISKVKFELAPRD